MAFDFFGLFGSSDNPPDPSPKIISYKPEIKGTDDKSLKQSISDTSSIFRLKKEAPPDGEGLARRASADIAALTDTLWGSGYYDGIATVLIDGVDISKGDGAIRQAAARAEYYRNRSAVPVSIVVTPGEQFKLRDVVVKDTKTGRAFPADILPEKVISLKNGDAAPTAGILAAEARIVDRFRSLGHPFAKVVGRQPVVDHPAHAVDMTFVIDPGPKAGLGTISIKGSSSVDPAVIRSFVYTEEGDPYSPQAVSEIKKTVSNISALGSVRVRESKQLDENGNLPIDVEVADRPPNLIGFSTKYSTTDGPGVKAYWANRNLFGGGEVLRIDTDLSFLTLPKSSPKRDELDWARLGGKVSVSFVKPALWGTRNDLLASITGAREATDGYTSRWVNGTVAIKHRFSDKFYAQAGIEVERGQTSDAYGRLDYTLVGTPISVNYDSTDNALDPTKGIKLSASIAPYPTFLGSSSGFVVAKAQGSTYYALDEDARYILAARLGIGSIMGSGLMNIPANRRFYAGGGGSVRGYSYRSLSPKGDNGDPVGGKSLLEGSVEARIKVTDTIGVVPFFDFGTAFADSYPDFGENMQYAAGVGLRYYTAIGPIRADVAFPLNKRQGDKPVVFYLSLGQAF
ncbi:autotransporter assembly complex protein TamA [Hohaiivirga grylli]